MTAAPPEPAATDTVWHSPAETIADVGVAICYQRRGPEEPWLPAGLLVSDSPLGSGSLKRIPWRRLAAGPTAPGIVWDRAPTLDALYVTHRTHPAAATPSLGRDLQVLRGAGRDPARDTVEVMTFLTAPADLTIITGARTTRLRAEAGVNAYSVPLAAGPITARAERAGVAVAAVKTAADVVEHPRVQDLQYVGAGSLR